MGDRTIIQEDEAEFPTALLLWRECQCHLHASLVYFNRSALADNRTENIKGQESIFGGSCFGSYTFD